MTGKKRPNPEAEAAYVRLLMRLRDISDNGAPAPCEADPERWYSDDLADREAAAHACRTCLAFAWCAEYADLAREQHGTWAGVHRDIKTNGRKKAS